MWPVDLESHTKHWLPFTHTAENATICRSTKSIQFLSFRRVPILPIVSAMIASSLRLIVALLLLCNQISLTSPTYAEDRPPNIILIMADDLGFGELGCYGQKIIKTPRIDQLASEGIKFTNFYCGNNVCAPSRCCLMTGKHPGHATIRDNANPKGMDDLKEKYGWEFPGQIPIPEGEVTLPSLMKKQGYATGAMGKWGLGHVGTSGDPAKHGFDLFYGYYCQVHAHNHYPKFLWRNDKKERLEGNNATLSGAIYSQDRFIVEATSFIESNKNKPFFLYLPFTVPHLSLQVPDESLRPYSESITEEDYKHTAYLQHPQPRAAYAAMVNHMDKGIGQIVDLLESLHLSDNTIIVFTSDNGPTYDRLGGTDSDYFQSTAGLRGRKGSMFEGGIRAPMIVRWKNHIAPNGTSDWLGASWDILPTLCEAASIRDIPKTDGISFMEVLFNKPVTKGHNYLYWESPGYGGQQAVRTRNWKAVREQITALHKKEQPLVIKLFDMRVDLTESNDVADKNPEIVRQMNSVMKALHTPSKLFPFPALDETHRGFQSTQIVAGLGKDESASNVTDLKLNEPFAVDFDSEGNLYVCEMSPNRIKRILKTGQVELVVGTGEKGFAGDGDLGKNSKLDGPHHHLFTPDGSLLIADTWNAAVRKWDPKSNRIETIVGQGKKGFEGDNGPANQAALRGAYSIDLDRPRNKLYIADLENKRVRMVDLKSSIITTIAGNGKSGIPKDGQPAVEQPLVDPRAVAVDDAGRVYILERGGHALRRVEIDGTIRTVAGTGKAGFSGDEGPALEATFNGPKHLIVDTDQTVLIADTENHVIRRYIPESETIHRVAGTGKPVSDKDKSKGIGGTSLEIELNRPHGVQRGPDGWLYISDSYSGRIIRIK